MLALLGGAGYLAWTIYFPPPKKFKKPAQPAVNDKPTTPVDPDEWIPIHHKKSKATTRASGATSGEDSEAAEGYASEKSTGGARKRKGGKR